MRILYLILMTLPLVAQQVTISAQPGQVFIANFGAPLVAVTVYSGEICSSAGTSATGSWGQIRQIAEIGGINVVDNVLVPATAQRAESKTKVHKAVQIVGVVGLATLFAAAFRAPPMWLIQGAATLTGGAQVLGTYLGTQEAQVQSTITAALGALADPTAIFNVSNGACVSSRLLLGQTIKNYVPIKATLASATVGNPSMRPNFPGTSIPNTGATFITPDDLDSLFLSAMADYRNDLASGDWMAEIATNLPRP